MEGFFCFTCQENTINCESPDFYIGGPALNYFRWLTHVLSNRHQMETLNKYKVFDNIKDQNSLVIFTRESCQFTPDLLIRPFSEKGPVIDFFLHPSRRFAIITYAEKFPSSSFLNLMLECNRGEITLSTGRDNFWACPKINIHKFKDDTLWDRLVFESLESIKCILTYPPNNYTPTPPVPMPCFQILRTPSISPPTTQFYNVEFQNSNLWKSYIKPAQDEAKTDSKNEAFILQSLNWVGREIYENIRRPSNLLSQSNRSCLTFEKNVEKLRSISCDSELINNHFVPSVTLNEHEIELRNQLIKELTQTLQVEYPNLKTHIFGSCYTGLAGPESDIDLLIDPNGNLIRRPGTPVNTILNIQRLLETKLDDSISEPLYKINPILNARVPILKVYHRITKINLDLSFGNYMSIQNSKLIKFYLDNFPPVKPLIVFLIYWLRNSKSPYLKNYSLVLLVLTHLSRMKLIPTIYELQELANESEKMIINDWDVGFCTEIQRIPPISVEYTHLQLIYSFFFEYSELDYEENFICSLTGEFLPRKLLKSHGLHPSVKNYSSNWIPQLKLNSAAVILQDPFELSFNTASLMEKPKLDAFKSACSDMLNIMTSQQCNSFVKLIIELPIYFKSDSSFQLEAIGIPINNLQQEVNSILDLSIDSEEELKNDPTYRWSIWKKNIQVGLSDHYKLLTFKSSKFFEDIFEVNLRQMYKYDISNFQDDLKFVFGQFLLDYSSTVWESFGMKLNQTKSHWFSSQEANDEINHLFDTKVASSAQLQKLLVDLPPMTENTQDEVLQFLYNNNLRDSNGMDTYIGRLSLELEVGNFSNSREAIKSDIIRKSFEEKIKEKLISELEFLLSTDPLEIETKVTENFNNDKKIQFMRLKLTCFLKLEYNSYNKAKPFAGTILLKLDNQDDNNIIEFNNICQEFETCFNDYAMFRLIKLFNRESCNEIFYFMEENEYKYSKIAQSL